MNESLQLVSGLSRETGGESLLVEALSSQGAKIHLSRLSDHELATRNGTSHPVIVLLVPIFGDNDLTDKLRIRLARLASCDSYRECAIVVVAHGDRHASDEFVTPEMPFSIKVRHLFSGVGIFEILETKLDRFTAATLAREILNLADATNLSDVFELNCIARLLPRAPQWNARKRMLDFYDPSAGSSLLRPAEPAVRKRIASHIQIIAPRILKMTHAGLGDDALADLGAALHTEVIDFGSNAFSWEGLVSKLGICRWLGLAANGLKQMPLRQLPQGLEHLYLQKNDLREFAAMPAEVARIKSLSLYRNRLTTFNWPAGQSALSRLNLGANPLVSLPETLGECTALEFLGLARTQISCLPEWVFSIQNLRELDISYIEDQIPPAQIAHLRTRRVSLITRPGLVMP